MPILKVSVIGLRGHAQNHIQSLLNHNDVALSILYNKVVPESYAHLHITENIDDCMDSDAIIISTPTHSHYDYMMSLVDFPGYILLEKPAVNTAEQIEALTQLPDHIKNRTRINFNFNFHKINSILESLVQKRTLGDIFALDIHTAHGVAFKSEWQGAWRIKSESGLGPVETTGIHFVQLAHRLFGNPLTAHLGLLALSNNDQYNDTGVLDLSMDTGVWVRVRHSYAAPYRVNIEAHGTDGYFLYDGENAHIYGPRDTFDSEGRFAQPPLIRKYKINYLTEWRLSLIKSQNFFLDAVRNKIAFKPNEFDRDVEVMKTLIDAVKL